MNCMRAICLSVILSTLLSASPASAQSQIDRNVVYGMLSGLALMMDVYHPAESKQRGVVMIPGSAFDGRVVGYTDWEVKGGYGYFNEIRDALVAAGYTVFVPNHRMAPVYKYPTAVEDVRRVVRFIRFNASMFSIDGDHLVAVGHSSGGYLASMLGVLDDDPQVLNSDDPVERESSRVSSVVAISAVQDMSLQTPLIMPFVVAFMGERPPMDEGFTKVLREGLYAEASTLTHVTPDDAAFLLIHGTEDNAVAADHLHLMEEAVRAADLEIETELVAGGDHWPALDHGRIVQWLDDQTQ